MDNTIKERILNQIIDERIRVEERKQMLDEICSADGMDEGVEELKQRLEEAQEQLKKAQKELSDLIARS